MSELSHFEALSAKTPTKQPWAIIGGTILLVIVLALLNELAPNEAIKESKKSVEEPAAAAAPAASADDDDEL